METIFVASFELNHGRSVGVLLAPNHFAMSSNLDELRSICKEFYKNTKCEEVIIIRKIYLNKINANYNNLCKCPHNVKMYKKMKKNEAMEYEIKRIKQEYDSDYDNEKLDYEGIGDDDSNTIYIDCTRDDYYGY